MNEYIIMLIRQAIGGMTLKAPKSWIRVFKTDIPLVGGSRGRMGRHTPSRTVCTDRGRGQPAKVDLVWQCKMCRAYILHECITIPPAGGFDGTPPAGQRALTEAGGSRLKWI